MKAERQRVWQPRTGPFLERHPVEDDQERPFRAAVEDDGEDDPLVIFVALTTLVAPDAVVSVLTLLVP